MSVLVWHGLAGLPWPHLEGLTRLPRSTSLAAQAVGKELSSLPLSRLKALEGKSPYHNPQHS